MTDTSTPSERSNSNRLGDELAKRMRLIFCTMLLIDTIVEQNISSLMTPARIAMRPMNHSATRIIFVLSFDRYSSTDPQRNRTGKIRVRFDTNDQRAAGI